MLPGERARGAAASHRIRGAGWRHLLRSRRAGRSFGGAEGIRTPDLLRWTGPSRPSADLGQSRPNPRDLRLCHRSIPYRGNTLPDLLGEARVTSRSFCADFPLSRRGAHTRRLPVHVAADHAEAVGGPRGRGDKDCAGAGRRNPWPERGVRGSQASSLMRSVMWRSSGAAMPCSSALRDLHAVESRPVTTSRFAARSCSPRSVRVSTRRRRSSSAGMRRSSPAASSPAACWVTVGWLSSVYAEMAPMPSRPQACTASSSTSCGTVMSSKSGCNRPLVRRATASRASTASANCAPSPVVVRFGPSSVPTPSPPAPTRTPVGR
jgi:hypothetical protein